MFALASLCFRHITLTPSSLSLALQEDTRFVPRVALEELNPDLEFEVMGEDDYGASSMAFELGIVAFFHSLTLSRAAMSDDDDDDDDDD